MPKLPDVQEIPVKKIYLFIQILTLFSGAKKIYFYSGVNFKISKLVYCKSPQLNELTLDPCPPRQNYQGRLSPRYRHAQRGWWLLLRTVLSGKFQCLSHSQARAAKHITPISTLGGMEVAHIPWMPRTRPFPSSIQPLFQGESTWEDQFSFILKLELIAITKISLLDSFWNRDWVELGNGLFTKPE